MKITRRAAVTGCSVSVGLGAVRKDHPMLTLLTQIRDTHQADLIPIDNIHALAEAFRLSIASRTDNLTILNACIMELGGTVAYSNPTSTVSVTEPIILGPAPPPKTKPVWRDDVLRLTAFNAGNSNRFQHDAVTARALVPTIQDADFVGICEYANKRDTLARKWLGPDFGYVVVPKRFCIAYQQNRLALEDVLFPTHEHIFGIRARHRESGLVFQLIVAHFNNASMSDVPPGVITSLMTLSRLPTIIVGDFNRSPARLAPLTCPPYQFTLGRTGTYDIHCSKLGLQTTATCIDNALFRDLPLSNQPYSTDTCHSMIFEHPVLQITLPLGLRTEKIPVWSALDMSFIAEIVRYAQHQMTTRASYPFEDKDTFFVDAVREVYKILCHNPAYSSSPHGDWSVPQMRVDIKAFLEQYPDALSPVNWTGLWCLRYPKSFLTAS